MRLKGKSIAAAAAHLRYIQRDGVQRDGSPGILYSSSEDEADGRSFLERCGDDRHQFRLIVSAEDGRQYADLKPLVRRFMERMEEDLGTRLEWVAADHLDTGHPHSHVILRGKDDRGQNLVIARDYIAHGMRQRLSELVSLDLGPRTKLEIEQKMRLEVEAERLTSLDRGLLRQPEQQDGILPGGRTMADHSLRVARLKKLEALGLAHRQEHGRWKLAADLEARLRSLSERNDIIRTMQRAMTRARLPKGANDLLVFDPVSSPPVIGRIVERGLADELADRHYVVVDAADGRAYHAPIRSSLVDPLPAGTIVGLASRTERGSPAVAVSLLSPLPLGELVERDGATWLDRELSRPQLGPLRDAGFGRELRQALDRRRAWLLARGLGTNSGGVFELKPAALAVLERRELLRAAVMLQEETGLAFAEPIGGERVEGMLKRRIDLSSGRFAMLLSAREFMLLPWKEGMEREIGREVSGLVRTGGVSWRFERQRGLER